MPNQSNGKGSNVYAIEGFWSPDNHPARTGRDNMIDLNSTYESSIVTAAVKYQWFEVDTDSITKQTGVSRRKQWSFFRAMAARNEISFKRVNTKTYIRLKPGETIDIPIQREKRLKGPVRKSDGVLHYEWCMTCKGTDHLTPSAMTYGNNTVRHYVCKDCQKRKKDNATVSFRKYDTEHQQRKRYEKLYRGLKVQYGIIRREQDR